MLEEPYVYNDRHLRTIRRNVIIRRLLYFLMFAALGLVAYAGFFILGAGGFKLRRAALLGLGIAVFSGVAWMEKNFERWFP